MIDKSTEKPKPFPWDERLNSEENKLRREKLLQQISLWQKGQLTEGFLDDVINPRFSLAIILLLIEIGIALFLQWRPVINITIIVAIIFVLIFQFTRIGIRQAVYNEFVETEIQHRLIPT